MQDIWDEGKYIDLWSVNHVLSGFVAAGWLVFLHAPTWAVITISSILFWGWEVIERIYKIEKIPNQVFDIITDYAGFAAFFWLYPDKENYLAPLISTTIAFLILELWGYVAYRKRPVV